MKRRSLDLPLFVMQWLVPGSNICGCWWVLVFGRCVRLWGGMRRKEYGRLGISGIWRCAFRWTAPLRVRQPKTELGFIYRTHALKSLDRRGKKQ
ncbi:hypothetical protein DFJ77DRAFT_479462 [Powellomyces hirtus]|nr:hypothetical protein DFJ77DRAFT_479462 [Powellomyces hirtus]